MAQNNESVNMAWVNLAIHLYFVSSNNALHCCIKWELLHIRWLLGLIKLKLSHCFVHYLHFSGLPILVCLHTASKELWRSRENRVLYALGNCLLTAKVSLVVFLLFLSSSSSKLCSLFWALGRVSGQLHWIAAKSLSFFFIHKLLQLSTVLGRPTGHFQSAGGLSAAAMTWWWSFSL